MDYFFEKCSELINLIVDNGPELLRNPIVWIGIALLIVGIYGLFNVSSKTKENGLANVIRQLIQVLIDTTGDLINAFRSLTGFIGVLRLLLFGKLNKRTLYILTNYAIIFLSMASFTTTFSGLQKVVAWPLAFLISFGVQVSILIFSIKIQRNVLGLDKRSEKKVRVQYCFQSEGKVELALESPDKQENEESQENKEKESGEYESKITCDNKVIYAYKEKRRDKVKSDSSKKSKKHPIARSIPIFILLIISIFVSSFFSYLFMFEKFIEPQLSYDDHFRTIAVSHEIINNFSSEMESYREGLTRMLSQYNSKVEEWLELRENNPLFEQNRLTQMEEELEILNAEIKETNLQIQTSEDGTPEYIVATEMLTGLEQDLKEQQRQYDGLSNTLDNDYDYQNRWMAYNSIITLTEFYANPRYLASAINSVNEETRESNLINEFTNLQQAEASFRQSGEGEHSRFDESMALELLKAFENYMLLSEYYATQDKLGVDFSEISAKLGEIKYSPEMEDTDYQKVSNEILISMIEIMNGIPLLRSVTNVWTDETVNPPSQTQYLEEIYNLYRDNGGKTTSLERSINKFFGKNTENATLARELAILALLFDLTIIWLTFLRGKRNYVSNISDLRRLFRLLFLDDAMERESANYQKGQNFSLTIGIVGGVLFYILYRMGSKGQNVNAESDVFTILFFCVMGLGLSLLLYRLYCKVYKRKQRWEDETLYLRWKEIWTKGIGSEEELQARIQKIQNGQLPELLSLTENDIRNIGKMYMEAKDTSIFIQHFYEPIINLFSNLVMKECNKMTFLYKMKKGKPYKMSCMVENIVLPCLPESAVKDCKFATEFNVLYSKHLVGFAIEETNAFFILSEHFWELLYDAVLLKIVGGKLSDFDIEEELQDNVEEEEEY